jgi:tRNA-splicing ligase RtcB
MQEIITPDGYSIKLWTDTVDVEVSAVKQLLNLSKIPFIFKHIAVMPDVHWGMGSTVGSVIPTLGAIIPAAVGVDIGCGMMAVKTPLVANDLPDNLFGLRSAIEQAIPHGRTNNGGDGDKGARENITNDFVINNDASIYMVSNYGIIIDKYPAIKPKKEPWYHLGTLGTGNHFIEICLDQNQSVWVMLHSGSRGIGNKIGTYFIEKAKEEMRKYHIDKFIPDIDLAYLVEKTELFDDYMFAVDWAQKFAETNRELMMDIILKILEKEFPEKFSLNFVSEKAINCHHNYVARENHFGSNVFITRKGAVRARKGDLGIIPGSMGAKSFIVRGKDNQDSFCSCSHGAGRVMSRNEAKKKFTLEDHVKATEGVECRKDEDVIDETPGAYKDIDAVMAAQTDLVDIVYTLKQVLCIKG